jgi:probable rRNA maturation factor
MLPMRPEKLMADSVLITMQEGLAVPEWFCNVEPFMQKVMKLLNYDGEEISVLFCTDDFIRELNTTYRHIDSPTDVLSFESGDEYEDEKGTRWTNMGDIVISLDMLKTNAAYFGNNENDELKRLLLHGLLHLNGMDHGEEHITKGEEPLCPMLILQEKLLAGLESERIMADRRI